MLCIVHARPLIVDLCSSARLAHSIACSVKGHSSYWLQEEATLLACSHFSYVHSRTLGWQCMVADVQVGLLKYVC